MREAAIMLAMPPAKRQAPAAWRRAGYHSYAGQYHLQFDALGGGVAKLGEVVCSSTEHPC
jgi:hypothetical protein